MARFILRRFLILLPLLLAVSLVVFGLSKMIPGDPVAAYVNAADIAANPEYVARIRAKFRLDEPVPVQYWEWLKLAVQGDFGDSIRKSRDVTTLLLDGMRNTMSIALAAIALVVLIGWTMGVLAAITYNRRWPESVTRTLAVLPVILLSLPGFSVAVVLVLIFAVTLKWLPTGGIFDPRGGGDLGDLARHMILPSIALSLASIGANWRLARNSMIEILREDYIRSAHAKGLPLWRVYFAHALRNAITPLITSAGLLFGALLTGSFVLEFIFSWPGIGRLMVESVLFRDVPVVMGGTMLLAVIYLLINLAVDVLYAAFDPRVRYG